MKKLLFLFIFVFACSEQSKEDFDFTIVFEQSNGTETSTYEQTIQFFKNLAKVYPEIAIDSIGKTDSGKPLHYVILGSDSENLTTENSKNKTRVLINNGIHPGESDGIDATMMLFRDYVDGKLSLPKDVVLITIPIYNIGGSLNRNSTSRTNQNGPKSYGFRGNARNYDLNRDFIKSDTENAKTFAQLFHLVNPDIFIDNHVSNGADYQYTLTHLLTQHNKLGGELGQYLHNNFMSDLESKLQQKEWDITPYVNVFNRPPDGGFSQFLDSPRYSTGYTTLFNTLGMMVETHMLKPYKQRVDGTYAFMKTVVEIAESEGDKIKTLREKQQSQWQVGDKYPLSWEIDTTKFSTLKFKGYDVDTITSQVTGLPRLRYNRSKPVETDIAYQDFYKPKTEVTIPKAYIIPQGQHEIIDLLKLNNIEFKTLEKDTILTVESYKIDSFETRKNPYEGHYLHYNTTVKRETKQLQFKAGDILVETSQTGMRYLLETLEPSAPDSFFNWNFFDTILQQKEGFSPYVWEDKAAMFLKTHPNIQIKFNIKKSYDTEFANNWYAQLDWIHKQSENYEKAHLQYPVYRLN